jgi:streptogramin lyase
MSRTFLGSPRRIAPSTLLGLLLCVGGSAQVTTVFPAAAPSSIIPGPDGAIWFTDSNAHTINRIDAGGTVTALPTAANSPHSMAFGPDGNLWFGDWAGHIGRMTPLGVITQFDGHDAVDITRGPDGMMWFVDGSGTIGRVSPAGEFALFPVPSASGLSEWDWLLEDIAAGPDGNLWFTEPRFNKIGRITTSGSLTEFDMPRPDMSPNRIVAGPDGNLWFTESVASPWSNRVGRISPTGSVTEFPIPNGANTIAVGNDGSLWLGWYGAVTRLTTDGVATVFPVTDVPDVWPAALAVASDGAIWIAGAYDWFDAIPGQIVRFALGRSDCVADATTLCLNGGRFRVTTEWKAPNGSPRDGRAATLAGNSGYFWFFDSASVEVVAKVLDGCSSNRSYWVFAAGLTNVEATLRVTDTTTGLSRQYANAQGNAFAPIQDTAAFPCP